MGPVIAPVNLMGIRQGSRASSLSRSAQLSRDARRAFGALLPLVDDPEVRDILVQVRGGGAGQLWVDRGAGAMLVPGWEVAADRVQRLAVELIAAGGRHLDELNPCADVRVGDGIRVHAVLPPVAVAGAAVSIRLPGVTSRSLGELSAQGLCGPELAAQLARAVVDRRNFLITGGTASGKTTLLTALLSLVPDRERVITIEDVAELRPQNLHHLALETRQANIEQVGEVTLEQLLREALRMRPDRIVLGECRGAEIATMLAALNTGHDGGAGTLHANRIEDVPARLEALGMLAGLPPAALARQAVSALHLVVHLGKHAGAYRIERVGRLRLGPGGELEIESYAAAPEERSR